MKVGIYLITTATVFLALWSLVTAKEEEEFDKIPTECPAEDPQDRIIYIPHENDCSKYYMCHEGKKILIQCPKYNEKGDRLCFDPRIQVCDWPWHAKGKHNDSDKDQAVATNEEFITKKNHNRIARSVNADNKCPDRNPGNTTILLPHDYDCTKFYMCLGREKIEQDCPIMNEKGDRLHFNPRRKFCDWPDKAGCDDKNLDKDQDEVIPKPPIPGKEYGSWKNKSPEILTECPVKGAMNTTIHLPHEYDCTKFYKCHGGSKFLKKCPYMNKNGDRLYFNPRLQICDWPESAGCELNEKGKCPPGSDGLLLPHNCNCTMYYECVKGDRVLRECPDNRYFSKFYQNCVKYEDSDCKNKKIYKCQWEGELIPHECDCTKYYKCRKDDQVLQKCEDGLHFSPERRICEDPDKAGCETGDEIDIDDCPKPTPKYPWRHECDCRLFYKCRNNKKRLYECPWGYYFDEKKNKCVWPELVTDGCTNHWERNTEIQS